MLSAITKTATRTEGFLLIIFYSGSVATGALYSVDFGITPGLIERQGIAGNLVMLWSWLMVLGGLMGVLGVLTDRTHIEGAALGVLGVNYGFLSFSALIAGVDPRYAIGYSSIMVLLWSYAVRRSQSILSRQVRIAVRDALEERGRDD